MLDHDDFDDFLARVEDVSQAVGKLARGKLDPDACEAIASRYEGRRPPTKPDDDDAPGHAGHRPGPGNGDQYAVYCRRCAIEHDAADIHTCAVCHQADALESRPQRHAYLKQRVQQLMTNRDRRADRRRRWQHYQQGRTPPHAGPTDFEAWRVWEPSDSDTDDPVPALDDPRFAALDGDLRRRDAERDRKRREAEALKADGNACLGQHRYHQACDLYTRAIDLRRDCPAYYTNRALAQLSMGRYAAALADCDTALDLIEFVEAGARHRPGALKAWLRRAQALDGLGRRDDAIDAVRDGALVCAPDNADARALLAQLQADAVDAARERALRADAGNGDLRALIGDFGQGRVQAGAVVARLEADPDARILFRAWKGLRAALDRLPERPVEIVPVLIAASADNQRNLRLIADPVQLDWVAAQLQSPAAPPAPVALALCRLLRHLAQLERVRRYLTSSGFAAHRLWHALRRLVREAAVDADLHAEALGVVARLADDARFRGTVRDDASAERIHRALLGFASQRTAPDAVKERALLALAQLLRDGGLRDALAADDDPRLFAILVRSVSVLGRRPHAGWYGRDALLFVLAAVLHLAQAPAAVPKLLGAGLVRRVAAVAGPQYDGDVRRRALLVLGRCPASDLGPALAPVWEALSDPTCREPAARVMAVLSRRERFLDELYGERSPDQVRQRLAKAVSDSDDNGAVGNLCLCVSRCLQGTTTTVIDDFAGIVERLIGLVLTSGLDAALRKNAAIVLAKMSAAPDVLAQLRQRRVLECIMGTAHQLLR